MTANDSIVGTMRQFLDWCPPEYYFPVGTTVPLLQNAETSLIDEMGKTVVTDSKLRNGLSVSEAYQLATLAIRSALFAARRLSPNVLLSGLNGLMIDDDELDWRDVLIALALVEDCAKRLGLDFDLEVVRTAQSAATDSRRELIEDYLARTPEMREIDVMGYASTGSGEKLTFVELGI